MKYFYRPFYFSLTFCLIIASCSTQKNRFLNKQYHSINTKYNVVFNGKEALKVGEDILNATIEDNFFEIIKTPPQITLEHLGLLIIYSCLAIGISQILWIKSVAQLGIGLASFHLNAAPFYVMLILFLIGGSWIWNQTIGAIIVIIGVILAQKKSANKKAEFFELP